MFRYSVIIPAYNEEKVLRETLSYLTGLRKDLEIIIADGGSTDRTIDFAQNYFVKVIQTDRGKGKQLNEAAQIASGDIIIFLHADTKLPYDAFESIDKLFSTTSTNITTFRLKFDKHNFATNIYSYFSRFDSILTTFGDQAIVCRKSFYNDMGGFRNYKTFEDVEFFQRVRKETKLKKLNSYVETSSRRYEKKGFIYTQLLNLWFITRYLLTKKIDAIYSDYFMKEMFVNKNAVIIFIKFPQLGKVKTRLAETTGEEFALKFYEHCVQHIMNELKIISSDDTDIYVFYNGSDDQAVVRRWMKHDFHLLAQTGENLGDKIISAFQKVFNNGYEKVIIIGSDIPEMSSVLIKDAFKHLDKNDAVISPSPDGGYNLLGLKELDTNLFLNINWSTSTVLEETKNKLTDRNKSYTLLNELLDIDTEKDLIDWLKSDSETKLKNTIIENYSRELAK